MKTADLPGSVGKGRLAWWIAALAILLAGFALRAAYHRGQYWLSDESITTDVVNHLRRSGDWDTNWAKAATDPNFRVDQYNFSSHLYATYFFYRLAKLVPGTAAWRSAQDGLCVYRFFSVLLGTLAVWQTLALGRGIGGATVGLAAGALAAASTLLIQDSHYARPEPFVTVLTLAAVGLCLFGNAGDPTGRRLRRTFLAAAVIGLLIACKISMALLAWLPLVPWLAASGAEAKATLPVLRPRSGTRQRFVTFFRRSGTRKRFVTFFRRSGTRKRFVLLLFGTIGAGLFSGFIVGAPGAVLHPHAFTHGATALWRQYAAGHPPYMHADGRPVADILARYFAATLGWLTVAVFAIGAVALLRRNRWQAAVLVAPVLLFLGFFATRRVFFERNLSHVVPLICLVAAVGIDAVARYLSRSACPLRAILQTALTAGAVAVPLKLSLALVDRGFSNRDYEQHLRFEADLRARYPNSEWLVASGVDGDPLSLLERHVRTARRPVLLNWTDFQDDFDAAFGSQLTARFDTEVVADHPGLFPTLPVCTLVTYSSWHDHYLLVRGVRPH